ncbi:MAG: hypothetical protein VX294_09865 [Candidatus Latescibacterota bacterium]|nr:hypothetical protein [Candidatus Latescibacterota bacterium]
MMRLHQLVRKILWFCFLVGCAPLTQPIDPTYSIDNSVQNHKVKVNDPIAEYWAMRSAAKKESTIEPLYIAILPFLDESGFRENLWDLPSGLARLLGDEIGDSNEWRIIPYDALCASVSCDKGVSLGEWFEVGKELKADILALGVLLDYDMKRLAVGDPLLGGYKSYVGLADIEIEIVRVEDSRSLGKVFGVQEVSDRDLGLDLFGKPRDQDVEFANLHTVSFGSDEFRETLIGRATLGAMNDAQEELVALLQPENIELDPDSAVVLSWEKNTADSYQDVVYISVGSQNGLRVGFRLIVIAKSSRGPINAGDQIGVLQVSEIVGANLARARILKGIDAITTGDYLDLYIK